MSDWWNEGYETAFDSNRIEIFEARKTILSCFK